jgi:pilus assembly protein CpaB
MKMRAILVLVLALICGVSAAVGVSRLRQSSGVDTASVVIARGDIPRGRTLTEDQVELRDWPSSMIPRHAVQKIEDIVGREAAVPIVAGDVLSDTKLAGKDAGRGVAALVPSGMRAYTIQTSKAASNVAGFVLPGNRVDVLLSLHGNFLDENGRGSCTTLLQGVEILAVDQRLDAPAENKVDPKDLQSVTLLVTPKQAALLDLGQNLGQLNLSLRNLDDRAEVDADPVTLAELRLKAASKSVLPSLLDFFTAHKSPPTPPQPYESAANTAQGHQPPPPRPTITIRTLRGVQSGEVVVGF